MAVILVRPLGEILPEDMDRHTLDLASCIRWEERLHDEEADKRRRLHEEGKLPSVMPNQALCPNCWLMTSTEFGFCVHCNQNLPNAIVPARDETSRILDPTPEKREELELVV